MKTSQLLGIFARTYHRDGDVRAVAEAVSSDGFGITQLNLNVTGHATLPAPGDDLDLAKIQHEFQAADVTVWGLSGTYNMIHPDSARRSHQTRLAAHLIKRSPALGCDVVTLCTGSRDAENMWRAHPDNGSARAWTDFRQSLDALLPHAAAAQIRLGIEPEPGNVVANARRALRLITELDSSTQLIGIVLDPANLITPQHIRTQHRVLSEAFETLGPHVVALHAKDVRPDGTHCAAGRGALDYAHIFRLAREHTGGVPVIIQDVSEVDVSRTRGYLTAHLEAAWR